MVIINVEHEGLNGPIRAQLHPESFESSALHVPTKGQCLQPTFPS